MVSPEFIKASEEARREEYDGPLYFADTPETTTEYCHYDFRTIGTKDGVFGGLCVKTGEWLKVSRIIHQKKKPSKHKCDDRCIHASGRTMNCECTCGGVNHGRGY